MDDINIADLSDLVPDKSAAELVKAVRRIDSDWHAQLPEDAQIVIYVPLVNGKVVELGHLQDLGYNGLYIQGRDGDGETYVLLAHQATVQFFFKVRKITPEQPRREIGFGASHSTEIPTPEA
jgi:hypothetical protein